MCGICGIVNYAQEIETDQVERMVQVLHHRGPDDNGVLLREISNASVAFGHARLSILDLSYAGHQPMSYNHLDIVLNGEIYNFKELRKELEELGHSFKSNCDTEVILHAFEQWDTSCVGRFIGMFAFVILDRKRNRIFMFRDRAGVKPLYYYKKDNVFLFASELKSFYQHENFIKEIDAQALPLFFDYGYIPAPYSIFKNCFKLLPGHILELDLTSNETKITKYWNPDIFYKKSKLSIDYEDAREQLHDLLISAFKYRMVSDVPVGVFLSGGYDSTSVAAILQKHLNHQLKTFTIGFEEGNNEAPDAKRTAEILNTDHYEYTCTTKEAQSIIPDLPYFYDEPFADSSAIPTMLVSRMARKEVAVALSADGGDEAFAGYTSYLNLKEKLNYINKIPGPLKAAAGLLLSNMQKVIPAKKADIKHKIDGVAKSINTDVLRQSADLFRMMNSLPGSYVNRLFLKYELPYKTGYNIAPEGFHHELEIPLAVDYQMYLQDDILTKVDRATMSVSLEGREPLLDHRILEYVARLPLNYKLSDNISKKILKDIVHQYIPKSEMNRPKAGFSLPILQWLRGDLSHLIDEYLNKEALERTGLFNSEFILEQVRLFKINKLHYSPFIWKILMFQMWYAKWMKS